MPSVAETIKAALNDPATLRGGLPRHVSIDTVLAQGGQGIVFSGTVNSKPAAVKAYFPGQVQQRVDREVAALGQLGCRRVAALLWAGQVAVSGIDIPVVATALVPGRPLSVCIESGPVAPSILGAIAFDVAEAIQHLWATRLVHRDLKPSNIVLTPENRACVIDLGVAKHIDLSPLTVSGMTWGTLGYLSPEQLQGARQLTCKSDLFALGVVLLESALGSHPTQGDQLRLLASRFHELLPPTLADWPLAKVTSGCLSPQPERRPLPAQVMAALAAFAPST